MLNIREATTKDSKAIQAVSLHLGYAETTDQQAQDRLDKLLSSSSHKIWVCEQQNTLHGWIHVFIADRLASPSFVEIGGLVVAPSQRRTGMGQLLVAQAKQWACEQQLSLRVRCNAKRESAHHFYQSIGFALGKSQHIFEAPQDPSTFT